MSEARGSEALKLIYDYDYLLQRLYSRLPARTAKASRFELPKLMVERIGTKTMIRNFKQLSSVMRREPRLVMRYLLKELGTSGNYDEENGILVINAKVSSTTLGNLIQRFVKTYVICPTCGAPDTKLERRGKAWILICEACGAEQPVPPL
ncbi:translation initiation factor IF-2 subunit beta [Pyrodictium delaneyi]|uniref:Translation initiation factor 2 subunit beta n=1 Tax=Pyrodictium delaneyi TaxID=1273541 RepID=A0A0P0N4F4_9CREN|nr:translation initiation factor IF-2 subunit beta [Pyrodictium delaneyi]ALL01027.1 translation initiation factor IF-2 subunit beta [Pyrodictium delaneyi]OWJ55377.1 translation initiation factor IF-2 subunit beta [Pyrodictium delaneyi]